MGNDGADNNAKMDAVFELLLNGSGAEVFVKALVALSKLNIEKVVFRYDVANKVLTIYTFLEPIRAQILVFHFDRRFFSDVVYYRKSSKSGNNDMIIDVANESEVDLSQHIAADSNLTAKLNSNKALYWVRVIGAKQLVFMCRRNHNLFKKIGDRNSTYIMALCFTGDDISLCSGGKKNAAESNESFLNNAAAAEAALAATINNRELHVEWRLNVGEDLVSDTAKIRQQTTILSDAYIDELPLCVNEDVYGDVVYDAVKLRNMGEAAQNAQIQQNNNGANSNAKERRLDYYDYVKEQSEKNSSTYFLGVDASNLNFHLEQMMSCSEQTDAALEEFCICPDSKEKVIFYRNSASSEISNNANNADGTNNNAQQQAAAASSGKRRIEFKQLAKHFTNGENLLAPNSPYFFEKGKNDIVFAPMGLKHLVTFVLMETANYGGDGGNSSSLVRMNFSEKPGKIVSFSATDIAPSFQIELLVKTLDFQNLENLDEAALTLTGLMNSGQLQSKTKKKPKVDTAAASGAGVGGRKKGAAAKKAAAKVKAEPTIDENEVLQEGNVDIGNNVNAKQRRTRNTKNKTNVGELLGNDNVGGSQLLDGGVAAVGNFGNLATQQQNLGGTQNEGNVPRSNSKPNKRRKVDNGKSSAEDLNNLFSNFPGRTPGSNTRNKSNSQIKKLTQVDNMNNNNALGPSSPIVSNMSISMQSLGGMQMPMQMQPNQQKNDLNMRLNSTQSLNASGIGMPGMGMASQQQNMNLNVNNFGNLGGGGLGVPGAPSGYVSGYDLARAQAQVLQSNAPGENLSNGNLGGYQSNLQNGNNDVDNADNDDHNDDNNDNNDDDYNNNGFNSTQNYDGGEEKNMIGIMGGVSGEATPGVPSSVMEKIANGTMQFPSSGISRMASQDLGEMFIAKSRNNSCSVSGSVAGSAVGGGGDSMLNGNGMSNANGKVLDNNLVLGNNNLGQGVRNGFGNGLGNNHETLYKTVNSRSQGVAATSLLNGANNTDTSININMNTNMNPNPMSQRQKMSVDDYAAMDLNFSHAEYQKDVFPFLHSDDDDEGGDDDQGYHNASNNGMQSEVESEMGDSADRAFDDLENLW